MRESQLFNLAQNPHEFLSQHRSEEVIALTGHKPEKEERNLAQDPRYVGKLEEMRQLDDPYRIWNQPDEVCLSRSTGKKSIGRRGSAHESRHLLRRAEAHEVLVFAFPAGNCQARISLITFPATSVRRKSRPLKKWVRRS